MKTECYLKSPTVQGLIFEEELLYRLTTLHIDQKFRNGATAQLSFTVKEATHQLDKLLDSAMTPNSLYHLHTGHPVIDGVCLAKNDVMYLLLIQVSLSSYINHSHSKARNICDNLRGTGRGITAVCVKLKKIK